jgi:tetrahydromethanopterin S-methyltransferase subunit B
MAGKSGKMRDEDYKSLEEVFWASNKAVLVDEINISEKIDELDEFIDEFMSEVDLVLSEINGRTDITIEY